MLKHATNHLQDRREQFKPINIKKHLLLLTLAFFISSYSFSQETYNIGKTEYYSNQDYSTTGKSVVKRSEANKR